MTERPGQNNADPAHSQQNALWQDLVARLREGPDAALFETTQNEAVRQETSREISPASQRFADVDPLQVSSSTNPQLPQHRTSGAPLGPRDYVPPEEDDDQFLPPDPAPLSSMQPSLVLGWAGAAGAPLALAFCALFWRSAPAMVITALILVFLAGAGYLIKRLPSGDTHRDDDGAAV